MNSFCFTGRYHSVQNECACMKKYNPTHVPLGMSLSVWEDESTPSSSITGRGGRQAGHQNAPFPPKSVQGQGGNPVPSSVSGGQVGEWGKQNSALFPRESAKAGANLCPTACLVGRGRKSEWSIRDASQGACTVPSSSSLPLVYKGLQQGTFLPSFPVYRGCHTHLSPLPQVLNEFVASGINYTYLLLVTSLSAPLEGTPVLAAYK